MENLDLDYQIMVLLAEHPDAIISSPVNLHREQDFEPLEDLCKSWGTNAVLIQFYNLEEYQLVGRSGERSCYQLTAVAEVFLRAVDEHGGWPKVKKAAIDLPVRPVMNEVCRWVLDGCPSVG